LSISGLYVTSDFDKLNLEWWLDFMFEPIFAMTQPSSKMFLSSKVKEKNHLKS